jgi:hypothetical protein
VHTGAAILAIGFRPLAGGVEHSAMAYLRQQGIPVRL